MGVDQIGPGKQHTRYDHPPMNPALATPLYVLGGFFVVSFLSRSIIRLRHHRRLREILREDKQEKFARNGALSAFFNKHVFYAPLWSLRHSREFRLLGRIHMGIVPLRLEAVLLLTYFVLNIIFFFVLANWCSGYEETMYQIKYAAGHLCVMNLPALVLTAARNNPLIPMLGLQFDTFNLMHRWIGRLIIGEAVVHMACVVAGEAKEMSMSKVTHLLWNTPFFIEGFVALIAFMVILFQSTSPIRHAFYEFFLHLHILLAITSFVGLWYHLRGLVLQRVLLVTLILWGLDRIGRLGSIIWRNFGKQRTMATVELLPGDVARVDVALARSWTFKPGQYMYLYMPSLGLWTSHPFSVAWTDDRTNLTEKRGSNDSVSILLGGPKREVMSFLIKRRDGFTNKLLEKVNKSMEGKFTASALVEGPFGGLHSLSSYGTVLLIAGGIGITHPMSYLHEILSGFSQKSTAVRKVSLIWVIRSIDHLEWIQPWMTSLMNHPALQVPNEQKSHTYFQFPELSLSIQIYLTLSESTDEYSLDESPWTNSAPPSVPISMVFGKPSFDQILESEKAQQVGAMAVSVCGPGGMGDDVRKCVRDNQGTQTIDLYEASFCW
ncbi:ferric reductase NAD binding domain-containing protein [Aspergillus novoparasiticus]|uniref:ferric-chelate reductase (NADPH) n=1 Tax=Aspergillus novoparasiticus TaxID=986946 RepID=A0A5N6EVY9_9EURO|nr:ferric reductase NAD binding domain-containing protein [Aspergillus novoparasiticus]